MADNHLYYGDNLDILGRYIKDETVDLVYLAPPFNSNVNYDLMTSVPERTPASGSIASDMAIWHREPVCIVGECSLA